MANVIDACSVNVQAAKADKNNNTTANIDDGWNKKKKHCQIHIFSFL